MKLQPVWNLPRILTVLTDKPKQRKVRDLFQQVIALRGRRNPFVAQEGLVWLGLCLVLVALLVRYAEPWTAVLPLGLFVWLFLVFRDPIRDVPPAALGVVSPVDGKVVAAGPVEQGATGGPVQRIRIAVNAFGTYTARSPVEGSIRDLGKKGLWLQTDEDQDVVLTFAGYRFGLAPRSFARYGERLGQGQRCAYLRLTRFAEVEFSADAKILVEPGQKVRAGSDVLGSLPSTR